MKLVRYTNSKRFYGETRKCGLFLCSHCGSITEYRLLAGYSNKSCGCNQNKITHGGSKSLLHERWKGIKARCRNTNHIAYIYYGKIGIDMCDEWNDFSHGSKPLLQIIGC